MKDERNLGRPIKQLTSLFNRQVEILWADIKGNTDMTGLQGWVAGFLMKYHGEKDIFQKDIEDALKISRSTASALLQRMEEKKLIVRQPLPNDARWKTIVLTKKSLKLRDKMQAARKTMDSMLVHGLTEKEADDFIRIADKIIGNLEIDRLE